MKGEVTREKHKFTSMLESLFGNWSQKPHIVWLVGIFLSEETAME